MAATFLDIAITPDVMDVQHEMGSDSLWQTPRSRRQADRFGDSEAGMIATRDSFYLATVSQSGWPYIQHRGGPPGFLHLLDDTTLAMADFGGNRQYITTGNLRGSDRACLFLMDYPRRARLKIYATVEVLAAEDHPQLLAQAHAWLFISSLINHRLTGEFTTDLTMAGTSQMLDLRQRDFSAPILQATGLPRRLFPRLVEAGQPIGALLPEAAALLGLPVGIPVISAGHDTQFALFGAGAGQDEPVLSSGTWEILMVRSAQVDTSLLCDYSGSTCELDSQPGRYNPGMQWLASGVLEWVRKLLWSADTPWQTLIDEAQAIPPGAQDVRMQCDLLASQHAGWQGVTLNTTRGHFYRAALEGLSDQLAQHLQTLEKIGGFRAKELLLVGGGSRNALWNQIKANRLGIPIKVLDDAETTVAGAAMFGWYGVGEFSSPEQARAQVAYRYRYFWPQTEPELIEEA